MCFQCYAKRETCRCCQSVNETEIQSYKCDSQEQEEEEEGETVDDEDDDDDDDDEDPSFLDFGSSQSEGNEGS